MKLQSLLLVSLPALALFTSCATTNNWQNDDVYSVKEPEVPIGTDVNDETDYSAYVYNRRTQERKEQYFTDRTPRVSSRPGAFYMRPSVMMTYGSPYYPGMFMTYGGGFSPYAHTPYFDHYYGYTSYYGYNPYYGYSSYYNPYYGYGSYYNPYYGYGSYYPYGGYGNSVGFGQGSGGYVHHGSRVYGHRGTYAGVGGTSSRPNGAVQIAKPNQGRPVFNEANASGKSTSIRTQPGSTRSTREVSTLTTPGEGRVSNSTVRSRNSFERTPVTRTTENVRVQPSARPQTGGVTSGGRVQTTGRSENSGSTRTTPSVSTPRQSSGTSTPRSGSGSGTVRTGSPGRR